VRSSGGDVRVTGTDEDTKVIIAGRGNKESLVRVGAGEAVEGRRLSKYVAV
jgi:hypothetical protein